MNDYFQYVHNLKGVSQYEKFKPVARDAIISVLLRQLEDYNTLEKTILKEADKEVLVYISDHLDLKSHYRNIILSTDSSSYVDEVDFNNVHTIINLRRINNTQHPNKLFRAVNTLLPVTGLYIGRIETYNDRKLSFFKRYGKRFGQFVWISDFFFNRVLPRLNYFDILYNRFTQGRLHCISECELLGRLVYCGFKIINIRAINGLSYFIAMKVKEPLELTSSSYYPIIKLSRVGKDGNLLGVYKLRTMHPYSEYIQDYFIKKHGYDNNGKPANDYRITRWGKFIRKWWIDELPQLVNMLRGEMKLVGLRPLSQVRFDEFPDDLKAERIKYKPGCIPPYVALNMPGDKQRVEAERIYIHDYNKRPYITDAKYLCKAIYNVIFKKAGCS
jgi:lipopolysaccharide/colanic/teichoic acid biosynthesis glycosyltransferase